MENYTFKSVAFGGFAKEDVVHYIEKAAKEAAAVQEKLQQENDGLKAEIETLQSKIQELQDQVGTLEREQEQNKALLAKEMAARQALEPAKLESERLAAEVERLRPDAEAYIQFRDRIGEIECEAHKRVATLEKSTVAKLQRAVDTFRGQYQELMSGFETAADYVTGELRKVEVNLSQLPRAMDQVGTELKELSTFLNQAGKTE